MSIRTICILMFVFLLNFKEENKVLFNESNTEKRSEFENYFSLSIYSIIENDGEFTLYYLDEEHDQITEENSVNIKITGDSSPQLLNFKLKEDVLPTKLLLKFNNEQKYQKVQIVNARLNYFDTEILISKENFYQFFIPNEFIDYNQENFTATASEKNGEFKPHFFSRKVLDDRINLIFY